MTIYPPEIPLETLIRSTAKSRTSATVKSKKAVATASVECDQTTLTESEKSHPFLLTCEAILCSTVMNLNEDVFLPYDTWAARKTCVSQPVDIDHEREEIIGHITGYSVLDKEGNIIDETDDSVYPNYFDLAVNFVIYKDIFPEMSEAIVGRAQENKAFVSMECAFDNFDYALIDGANVKIVKRNPETAFLTKHLSAYGGIGKYGEYKIGRVLRDIVFCGMGDVTDPANPASKYLKIENYSYAKLNEIKKGETMATENTAILTQAQADEQIQAAVAKALGEAKAISDQAIATVKSELETLGAEFETTKTTLAQVKDQADAHVSKLDISQGELAKVQASLDAVNKDIEATKVILAAKTAELDAINAEKKVQARFDALTKAGITLDEAKKAKIPSMSDEAFASVLEFASTVSTQPTDDATKAAAKAVELAAAEALKNAKPTVKDAIVEGKGEQIASLEEKMQEIANKLVTAVRKSPKTKK